MAKPQIPTPHDLRQLLRYEPKAGNLFWRERGVEWFNSGPNRTALHKCRNWNSRYSLKRAFTAHDAHGYLVGSIFDVKYKAHRVAWVLVHGEWPVGDVDHINGDSSDNRASNLRLATRSENMRNRGATKRGTSGLKGVSWDSGRRLWKAQIRHNYKNSFLGRFESEADAHAAYIDAMNQLHGGFSNSG